MLTMADYFSFRRESETFIRNMPDKDLPHAHFELSQDRYALMPQLWKEFDANKIYNIPIVFVEGENIMRLVSCTT